MEINEIRDLCIRSSEKYYNFLDENKKGIEEIEITKKSLVKNSESLWELMLGGRIFNIDAVKIFNKRYQELYSDKHFSVESYDSDINKLIIELKGNLETFKRTDSHYLLIISDLKFLVENVKNWYINNGNSLILPSIDDKNDDLNNKQEIKFFTEFDTPNEFQKMQLKMF